MPKNTKSEQLLLPILNEQKPPLCKCGCGATTEWSNQLKRFCFYLTGHNLSILWKDPEHRKRMSEQQIEVWKNPEHRKLMSEQRIELWKDPEYRQLKSKQSTDLWKNPEHRERMAERATERRKDPEFRKRMSKQMINRWKNPIFREKILTINSWTPNKPERIINMLTPEEVVYVGNRAWWRKLKIKKNGEYIEQSKNPDFKIKGQNKVIELYGDYWHKNDNPDDLINAYKEVGFDCLVIWESEIYNELENTIEKISQFMDKPQWQMTLL
jgi:hypothetical protein